MSEIHPEPAENVAEAIGHLLHEVEAARLDLSMTRFRLQQAEALRRFDRAKVSVARQVEPRKRKKSTRRVSKRPIGQRR